MTSNPHIKAGSGVECSEVRTRDTVEAIVAEMRDAAKAHVRLSPHELDTLADRLQSAHDAERAEAKVRHGKVTELYLSELNRADAAESRLREAHGLLREADRFLGFDGAEGELSDRIDRAMEADSEA